MTKNDGKKQRRQRMNHIIHEKIIMLQTFKKNVAKIKDTNNCSISFQVDNGKASCFGKIIEE
jgi:hypothetical protein